MKKHYMAITAAIMILAGCASLPKVNFGKLASREFVLTSVTFIVYDQAYQDTIDEAMCALPIAEVTEKISQKYGITVDADFFADKAVVKAAIKQAQVKLTDGTIKPLPLWVADFETAALQTVSLEFNFPPQSGDLKATANIAISDGTEVTSRTTEAVEIEPWALFSEKIDRENAAVLEIGKHLAPVFVNGNSYKVFYKNNAAGKNAIYLSPDKEYDINFTINDPGIFMIFDPVIITNKHWQGKLEPSKKYQLTYKLNRQGAFTNWTVDLILEEIK